MKILFIIPEVLFGMGGIGGTERVLNIVSKYLISNENEIRFLVRLTDNKGEIINDRKELSVEPFKSNKDKVFLFKSLKPLQHLSLKMTIKIIFKIPNLIDNKIIEEHLNDFKPDVVINSSYFYSESIKRSIKSLGLNSKLIGYQHTSFFYIYKCSKFKDKLRQILYKTVLISQMRYLDAHLAISTGIRDQILKLNPKAKVYIVFNPIEPYNGGLTSRSKKPIFLYVGRIDDKQKNLSFMFNGLSKIKKDWKLIIVGMGSNKSKLKNLSDSLGISQKIEWRGLKKYPYENLEEGITALLLTSRYEGFSMVLVEANQRGIPVISSDCKVGPSDIVINGINGYLYPEGDMGAFVKIVNNAIDGKLTFGTPEEIAKTAERFSEEKVCKKILEALNETIEN